MAKTGGYQIIDLKNNDLLSLSSLAGIYDAIEGSYRKPILLSGIVISGVEKSDIYVIPEVSGSSYVLRNVYGYDVTIADDDDISVASTQWATRSYVDQQVDTKTCYFHPIIISDDAHKLKLSLIIIDTTATAYDTPAKLLDKLYSLVPNGTARINLSGGYITADSDVYIASHFDVIATDATDNGKIRLYGVNLTDGITNVPVVKFEDIIGVSAVAVYDGVNAIN